MICPSLIYGLIKNGSKSDTFGKIYLTMQNITKNIHPRKTSSFVNKLTRLKDIFVYRTINVMCRTVW
jgi:hypothetical protein